MSLRDVYRLIGPHAVTRRFAAPSNVADPVCEGALPHRLRTAGVVRRPRLYPSRTPL